MLTSGLLLLLKTIPESTIIDINIEYCSSCKAIFIISLFILSHLSLSHKLVLSLSMASLSLSTLFLLSQASLSHTLCQRRDRWWVLVVGFGDRLWVVAMGDIWVVWVAFFFLYYFFRGLVFDSLHLWWIRGWLKIWVWIWIWQCGFVLDLGLTVVAPWVYTSKSSWFSTSNKPIVISQILISVCVCVESHIGYILGQIELY